MPFDVKNSILKDPNIISSVFSSILLTKPHRIKLDLGVETAEEKGGGLSELSCHHA
jgi:hypothetical protein